MSNEKIEKSILPETGKHLNRRDFLKTGLRAAAFLSLASITGYSLSKSMSDDLVWQIDPTKCVQCGKCATNCVLNMSAVKCMHVHKMVILNLR